ncbi:MAG: transglutaminase-like domain-containing protein, partial [Rubripirellula sp.]
MDVDPAHYLSACDVIDFESPEVAAMAKQLRGDDPTSTAERCFEFVRDEIAHSSDHQRNPVTCAASETLHHRTGYCYAKSHLLCALLRANQIPAGLCYQRLSVEGSGAPFCLHGLNAVFLP